MSTLILDDIVAELHEKHGEEADTILPPNRVGSTVPSQPLSPILHTRMCIIVSLEYWGQCPSNLGVVVLSQVRDVKDLIMSAHNPQLRDASRKKFLFDIVANGVNGIDVDKCAPMACSGLPVGAPVVIWRTVCAAMSEPIIRSVGT